MDISKIVPVDEDSGIVEHLKDPTQKPEFYEEDGKQKPVEFCVMGSWSEAFKKAARKANDARQDAARKGETLTPDEEDALDYETEAACIKWWCFKSNGQPLPITGPNWKALATKRPNWRTTLLTLIGDHERFFAASSAR